MKIIEYNASADISYPPSVVALGFFDGCHLGHKKLIERGKRVAEELSLPFSVFTFASEGETTKSGGRITTTEENLSLLRSLEVDNVYITRFESIRNVDAEEFISTTLLQHLGCTAAVVGSDFRFGKGGAGGTKLLADALAKENRRLVVVDDLMLFGKKVSSSVIKELLLANDLVTANAMLGHTYFCDGIVERGDGRGKKLGFPTANVSFPEKKARLGGGVYRTAIEVDGKLYSAVTNLGVCPTFEKRASHIESFIIDFMGDIYGKKVRIFFLDFIRDEIQYNDKNSLILQINVDKNYTIRENGELKWQEIGQSLQSQDE